jgi:hypothetical protein
MRNQASKQSDIIGELENKLEETEKKHKHAMMENNRASTPESATTNYFDPYSRSNRTRISRTPIPGSISASSNPVKMVQEMVGRVRVS